VEARHAEDALHREASCTHAMVTHVSTCTATTQA
jgi:hypothetical protein